MSNAAVLIPIVLVALQEYDRTSEAGATKVCEHFCPILQMLWAIMRGRIRECTCALDRSAEGKIWSTDCCHLCMIPLFILVPALIPANANQLQEQMHTDLAPIDKVTTGYLAIISMMDKDKLEKANKESDGQHQSKWKNIPEMMQQMIIKASLTSDEAFPNHPAATLLQILQQNKVISRRTVLNAMLQKKNCQIKTQLTSCSLFAMLQHITVTPDWLLDTIRTMLSK